MKIAILGGGIAGISFAYHAQNINNINEIVIFEKEKKFGGLLRSFDAKGIKYDVGPHIIFSKHKDVLQEVKKLLGKNKLKIKRSNKILYNKNTYIKYPFENDLVRLPENDKKYALNEFLKNPSKKIKPFTMQDFFLKTFGRGIFDLYLKPYNNKIWKMDVSKLDTQMVERIPKPPKIDIIKSANGIKTEGYKHQLYFHYPKKGGIQSLFEAYVDKLNDKVLLKNNFKLLKISKDKKLLIHSKHKKYEFDHIISTIPLNELKNYIQVKPIIKKISSNLQYNSIIIAIINIKGNYAGDNFAFMVPDKNIIFHRLSKLNFLGKNYTIKGTTTFEIEITYRKNSKVSRMDNNLIKKKIIEGLKKLSLLKKNKDINFFTIKKFKYAYVIYNLPHRKSVDKLIKYYSKFKISCIGRWGSWEYLNSDQVIHKSKELAKRFV